MQPATKIDTSVWSVNASIADNYDSDSTRDNSHSKQAVLQFDIENRHKEILRDYSKGEMDHQLVLNLEHFTIFTPKREDSLEFQFKNMYEFWKPDPNTFLWQNLQFYSFGSVESNDATHSLNAALFTLTESGQNHKHSQEEFQRKKVGRKFQFTGLSQRKDVVLKSLLRRI